MKTQTNTPNMETGSIPRLLAQLAIPAVVAQVINPVSYTHLTLPTT